MLRPLGKACWLVKDEVGGEKGGLQEQVDEVMGRLVSLVFHYLLELTMGLFGFNSSVFLLAK